MITTEKLKELASMQAVDAQPRLREIAEKAADRHGIDSIHINHADMVKVSFMLAEVQHQSFLLGMQSAMELCASVAKSKA